MFRLLLAAAALPAALSAQGALIVRPCPVPPPCLAGDCPLPRPRPCPETRPANQVEKIRSDVRVELADRVLRYEVTEVFVNRGSGLGEADYVFPLPNDAAFQDLRLSINGELVSGEALGAVEARRIYEDIVRSQRDPALVEWMGKGLLRARIFPIGPGEEKKVVVRYQSVAPREGDAVRVDYFRGSEPARLRSSFALSYPAGREYGTAYSPTHDVAVSRDGDRRRAEIRGGGSSVTMLVPLHRGRGAALSVLTYAESEDERFALVALSPPAVSARRLPRDVTLVLDVSGSMSGRKMEQARQAALRLLETLGPHDRFRIVDFSTDVRAFPGTADDMGAAAVWAAANETTLREARRYVRELDASGSTNISGALKEALTPAAADGRLALVLFMTDGAPTVGERRAEAIADSVRAWRRNRRVFALGLGADVNVTLLEQLALDGRGTAQFLRPEEDVERAVALAAQRLSTPVVTDVRLRAEGVQLRQVLPGEPVDLFAGHDVVFLARYQGDGDAQIVVTGHTPDGPVRWSTTARFGRRDRENRFIPRLWAVRRVGYLSAERRRHGASPEIDEEIRRLGEKYGIPTEFSSYLVLEPGVVAQRDRGMSTANQLGQERLRAGVSAAPAPAAAREFERARAASRQRDVSSLAVADSAASDAAGPALRWAGSRALRRVGEVWTDRREVPGARVLRLRAYSDAWFALARAVPELADFFAVGDRVRVAGRRVIIEVAPDGVEQLSDAEVARVAREWAD